MSIIRIASRKRYTPISNEAIENGALSFRARGILVWLLSKPDEWTISSEALTRAGTEGRDAVLTALSELEKAGYVSRRRVRRAGGLYGWETTVFESPRPGNPDQVEPDQVEPDQANPDSVVNTELVITEVVITEKTNTRASKFDEQFEQFCDRYPRIIGKPRAAWNRLTVTERTEALEAVGAWAAFWKRENTEPRFIPYPGKWLARGDWKTPPKAPVKQDPIQIINGLKRNTFTGSWYDERMGTWMQDIDWIRRNPRRANQ